MLRMLIIFLASLFELAFSIKTILVAEYITAHCDTSNPLDPAGFSGFEVDILRDAMAFINYTEGVDYQFSCSTFPELFVILGNNTPPDVIGAVCGITITKSRLDIGYKFSQPLITTGLSLLFRRDPQASFYLKSLDYLSLFSIFAVAAFLGIFYYIVEDRKSSLTNYIWHSINFYLHGNDFKAATLTVPSKLIDVSMRVFVQVILVLYIAFTTNTLSKQINFGGVSSIDDLVGLNVATFNYGAQDLELVGARRVVIDEIPIFTTERFREEVNNINTPYIAADGPVVTYFASTECNLYETLTDFVKYDFGVMLPGTIDTEMELLLNTGIEAAFENKPQSERWKEVLAREVQRTCNQKVALGLDYIAVQDVSTLWILWGAAVILGIITIFTSKVIRRRSSKNLKEYSFYGIRGNADRKIQGMVTMLVSFNVITSLFMTELNRKLTQRSFQNKSNHAITKKNVRSKMIEHVTSDEEVLKLKNINENNSISLKPEAKKQSFLKKSLSFRSPSKILSGSKSSLKTDFANKNQLSIKIDLTSQAFSVRNKRKAKIVQEKCLAIIRNLLSMKDITYSIELKKSQKISIASLVSVNESPRKSDNRFRELIIQIQALFGIKISIFDEQATRDVFNRLLDRVQESEEEFARSQVSSQSMNLSQIIEEGYSPKRRGMLTLEWTSAGFKIPEKRSALHFDFGKFTNGDFDTLSELQSAGSPTLQYNKSSFFEKINSNLSSNTLLSPLHLSQHTSQSPLRSPKKFSS